MAGMGTGEVGVVVRKGRRCDENHAPAAGNYLVSTTTAAAVATAKVSLDHRFGFIDGQPSTVKFRPAELGNRLVRPIRHRYKTKAFGSTCFAIRDNRDGFYGAVFRECVIEIGFCRLKRQISNKYFLRH